MVSGKAIAQVGSVAFFALIATAILVLVALTYSDTNKKTTTAPAPTISITTRVKTLPTRTTSSTRNPSVSTPPEKSTSPKATNTAPPEKSTSPKATNTAPPEKSTTNTAPPEKSTSPRVTASMQSTIKQKSSTVGKYTIPYHTELVTNQPWNDELNNPNSTLYQIDVRKFENLVTESLFAAFPGTRTTVTGFRKSSQVLTIYKKVEGLDDDIIAVLSTSYIPVIIGQLPPTKKLVEDTIDKNIKCTCNVISIDILTTPPPMTTTTAEHSTRPHIPAEYIAAEYLKRNMDEKYHPCENFYQFACGNFTKSFPTPKGVIGYGTFDVVQDRIIDKIDLALQQINVSDPTLQPWEQKVKRFYESCGTLNQKGIDYNRRLLEIIKDFGGWPIIMKPDEWNNKSFDLAVTMAKLTTNFSVQTLITAYVDLDWKKPKQYMLQIDQASLTLVNPEFYSHKKFEKYRSSYVELIKETAAILRYDQSMPQNDVLVDRMARDILDFETVIAKIVKTKDERQSFDAMYNPESVATIQASYNFMHWQVYFDSLLPNVITKPYNVMSNIVEVDYMKKLTDIVNKVKPETLQNYLVWRLVYSLNMFFDDRLGNILDSFHKPSKYAWVNAKANLKLRSRTDCTTLIINNLGFAASRLLVQNELDDDALNVAEVLNMTSQLKEIFKRQLDTLFWMDDESRETAKGKLDDYVEFAGFPKWLFNSKKMNDYYDEFYVLGKDQFFDNYIQLMTFHELARFRVLADTKVKRETWVVPPAIVDAGYLPEYNSIIFPVGILRPPFFRHDFPHAVNYGALGAIIGHEITHGFDDQGVQFNGSGCLVGNWMSIHSRIGFKKMMDCVFRQYDRTCYSKVDMCIDGVQTQGENTADNGGIREAYNAYRTWVYEHGEENRLPGLENYTMEQIFFISFANMWCGDFESTEYLEQQIVAGVHSPPPARVLNTLKNFADFGRTFQCEAGQPYYPFRSEACYVWDSPPVSTNPVYNRSAEYILANMNRSVDPCENFYEYACGRFEEHHNIPSNVSVYLITTAMQNMVYADIIHKLDTLPTDAPKAIQQAKTYYDICKSSSNNETINNTEILDILHKLGGWPAIDPTWQPGTDVNKNVSQLVGYLASMFGVQTFLVASTVVDPGDTDRHVLAIDQSTLALGAAEYYTEAKLSFIFEEYQELIMTVIQALNPSISRQDADFTAFDIANFERRLANILFPDTDRRNYAKLYNLYNVSEVAKEFPLADWDAYFNALFGFSEELQQHFTMPNASVIISEPKFLFDFGKLLEGAYKRDKTILQNYLLWRFIYARLNFMDGSLQEKYASFKRKVNAPGALPPERLACVAQLNNMLGYTVGRLFVDDWNSSPEWRADVSEMIVNITSAFDETIPILDWMDVRSKDGAKSKINNLVENPAFPDWILNNTMLDSYYKNYNINPDSTYFEAFNQLNQFAVAKAFEHILKRVNRRDFQMSPATVNAWYNPTLNSLTIPAGLLNPLFYHPELPAGLKYGYVGAVIGHELTHAFDDSGIQFDSEGFLDTWMTRYSQDSYDKNVESCIINQYNHFCHFDGQICNNGSKTQGENIADNGGIRQAFKAYRNNLRKKIQHEGYGEELLPGMEWFTEDQLFFLGFANLWCGYYSDKFILNQLMTDVHSPGPDRLTGTVRNFEKFDDAFQCKIGEPMNPKDKCYVWTNPTDTTDGYDKAAKMLLESIDPSTEPCDDFFQYACGGWIDKHPIPEHANSISTNSLSEDAVLLDTAYAIQNLSPNEKSTALQKAKEMFDFCSKDFGNSNSTSLRSFQQYVNEELGAWPIITKFWEPSSKNTKLQQAFELAGLLGSLGVPTIFNAYPEPNFEPKTGEPKDYALFVDQAILYLRNRDIYLNKTFEDVIDAYRDSLVLTAVELSMANCSDHDDHSKPDCRPSVPIESIRSDVEDIIDFEKALARISLPSSLQQNYTAMYNKASLISLKSMYENIDWNSYFSKLLPPNIWESVDDGQVDIIVSEPSYLAGLNMLLPFTSLRTIQNYLIWRYTIHSSSYFGGGMKKKTLLQFKQKTEFVEDLRDDIAVCTQDTINLLPYAAGRLYVEKTFGDTKKQRDKIKLKAAAIVNTVVDQFYQRLRHLKWLDNSSLAAAQAKIDNLVENIAYPDWIFNNTDLDHLYSLTIDTSKDYFTTNREVSKWFIGTLFQGLNQTLFVHRKNYQWSPAIQDAWYQPWLNSITIPAGEIQPPFFRMDFPAAVNFGGLGATAGHELTHGFDDIGVQFGPEGGLYPWMSKESSDYFHVNISECVINQYDQYCYKNLPAGKMCINGKATQADNIADNGGTKTAYNAYQEWVRKHGYEALLPGLESFTMNQIFFLSFAQTWCGVSKPEALERQLLLNPHSPNRDRVIGTLSDMKEFQLAFQCKPGDNMVPKERCDVW